MDLSGPRILKQLADTRFQHVEVHASIDSTQTLLVSEGGPDGRVVVADHQTAGRGRQGRSWLDVPGAMLMFSVLLRDVATEKAALASLGAGVAIARAIGGSAKLKWPNDVRVDGKKVCGILGELASAGWSEATPSQEHFVVVGIGVNVAHEAGQLPDELEATSIRIALGDAPRRDDLCASILREFDRVLRDDFMDDYRSLCETIGRRVRVELSDGAIEGVARGVRNDGALLVDDQVVMAGDVVHLR